MRARLIVNPAARQGSIDLDRVQARLTDRGWTVDQRETKAPGDAIELARQAVAEQIETVIACGGDGTINEVINGLAHSDSVLGVIPLGTANVWAAEMGIPRDPVQAADALVDGQVYRVDLGQAGDRYFLLMAGIGLDAEIVKAVPPTLKKHFGVLAFIIAGAHRVLGFGGERAIVDIDGVRRVRWLRLAVVGNTRLYGGLVTMTHEAYIDDGLLDIAIFTNRGSVLAHLQQLAHVFLRRPDPQAGYEYFRGREIRIWTRHRLEVQVDGEHYSQTPITLRVAPLALSVRLPKAGPRGPFSDSQLAESAEPDRPPVVGRMWSFSQQKPDPDS